MPNSSVPRPFGACAAAITGANRTASKPARIVLLMTLSSPITNLAGRHPISLGADNLSGLHVDDDVLLALIRRLDLDDVDILAALSFNRYVGDFAGDLFKRSLRRLLFRDLCPGRRPLSGRSWLLRLRGGHRRRKEKDGEQAPL